MAPKESANRLVSARTTAPIAPRTRSSHMNQNRCCPGVPNRYRLNSESSVTRPKSIATVVVTLPGVWRRSSIPLLASVITASVVSGVISDTEPTNVVLPTPKPPATTIFAEVAVRASGVRIVGSKSAESTQHPFHQHEMRRDVVVGECPVNADQAQFGHVTQDHPGHPERDGQLGGHLGHRQRVAAQRAHRPVLQLDEAWLFPSQFRRGDQRLQPQFVVRLRSAPGPRIGTYNGGLVAEVVVRWGHRWRRIVQPGRSDRTAQPAETVIIPGRGIIWIQWITRWQRPIWFVQILRDELVGVFTAARIGETVPARRVSAIGGRGRRGARSVAGRRVIRANIFCGHTDLT